MTAKSHFLIRQSKTQGLWYVAITLFFAILGGMSALEGDNKAAFILGGLAFMVACLAFALLTTTLELKDNILTIRNPLRQSSIDMGTLKTAERFRVPLYRYHPIIELTDKSGRKLRFSPLDYSYEDFMLIKKHLFPYIYPIENPAAAYYDYRRRPTNEKLSASYVIKVFAIMTVVFAGLVAAVLGIVLLAK